MIKLLVPAASLLTGIALLVFSAAIRAPAHVTFGPRFWPQALAWSLIIVNALIIGGAALRKLHKGGESNSESAADINDSAHRRRAAVPAALMLILPLCIQILGFVLGSLLFLIAFMRAVGYTKWWSNLSVSFVFTVVVTLFFTRVTYMPLPKGIGPFYQVSVVSLRLMHAI